jgi:hypothetical protein
MPRDDARAASASHHGARTAAPQRNNRPATVRLTKPSHKPAKASNNHAPIDAHSNAACAARVRGRAGTANSKKSSACPASKAKVHALVREHLVRRGGTATSGPTRCCSRGRACRLRTRGPVTKPTILRKTGILEALISFLYRPAIDDISLRGSHEGSKRGQSRYHHDKLAHSFASQVFWSTTKDCVNFAYPDYLANMRISTV